MSAEHTRLGRRSHGEAAHLQRAANAARLTGHSFVRPELPTYLSPEDRLDYDRFMFPALQKLPDETVSQINQNPAIVVDYYDMQMRILHGADERVEMTGFNERHPAVGRASMHILQELRPAFKLIEGRFRQAQNSASLGFGRNWLQGHPRRFR
ncbi:MAG TPA: hypothetical protein VMR59_01960 [Patescibacteria group bacterium]|jgi:hypothetical protein|nr:hypothetical protein [Patescibacteria group bacterium]